MTRLELDEYIRDFDGSTPELEAELTDEFRPYLYPNQYVWYTSGSRACALGRELSEISSDDLTYVQRVYEYVTENIGVVLSLILDIMNGIKSFYTAKASIGSIFSFKIDNGERGMPIVCV